MDNHDAPALAADEADSQFARQFGQGAAKNAPQAYRLLAISPDGGVLAEIPWEAMRAKASAISKHEDAFAWAAMGSNDVHASLLSCAIFAATTSSSVRATEQPKTLFRSIFEDFYGQGAEGVFEAAARFSGPPGELAQGLAKLFPQAQIFQMPAPLCHAAFPGKLSTPNPDVWRCLVEAAQLGSQAQPGARSSRPRV